MTPEEILALLQQKRLDLILQLTKAQSIETPQLGRVENRSAADIEQALEVLDREIARLVEQLVPGTPTLRRPLYPLFTE
jgi:hypothetical protein